MSVERRAMYFGYSQGGGGHFLRFPGYRIAYRPERDVPGFPWTPGLLDAGLLNNGKHKDVCDGRVFWTCGGRPSMWIAFFWWDRSGDKRGNSNSGFYVKGFTVEQRKEAFDYAKSEFPEIVTRQQHALVLQP